MSEPSQLDYIWVIVLSFAPMLICGAMLRAKGVLGVLAVLGILAGGVLIFMKFEGARLMVSGIAAVLGLAFGGQISDNMETNRLKRIQEEEQAKREAKQRYH